MTVVARPANDTEFAIGQALTEVLNRHGADAQTACSCLLDVCAQVLAQAVGDRDELQRAVGDVLSGFPVIAGTAFDEHHRIFS